MGRMIWAHMGAEMRACQMGVWPPRQAWGSRL